jgi:hypothetical protein
LGAVKVLARKSVSPLYKMVITLPRTLLGLNVNVASPPLTAAVARTLVLIFFFRR